MKLFSVSLAFVLVGLMAAMPASAQNYRQLRETILQQQAETRTEIEQIDALINQYERRLNQARQKYDEIYEQYENIKRLLALQEQKITALGKERDQISEEISVTESKLEEQQEKLKTLVENYKDTMRYLYKNGRNSQLAIILSSASVNQMMVRNYYLKKFETFREGQVDEIRQTQANLKESRQQLDESAKRNTEILAEIQAEAENLEEKEQQQETNVKLLRLDREKIEEKLTENREQKEDLDNTLSTLISREEEVRKAEQARLERQKRQEQQLQENLDVTEVPSEEVNNATDEPAMSGNRSYSGETGFINDEELAEIETAFASQKGKLPWPVNSSTISEHFGRRRHPIYGTVTPNLGIEIVTQARQETHVVEDGYVFEVRPVAGYGDVVFVSHGKFKTAYGNLSRVLVRKNTILKKGDLVGYAGDQNSTRGEAVFFMLREGNQNVDPEDWLLDK
jgi:septal ring factor EnvC (AmiA/AmiB activator)